MYSNIRPEIMFFAACMVMALGITGCQDDSASSDAEVVELEEYSTMISYKAGTLANPVILKYDGDSLLYVYDVEKKQVLALDSSGEVVNEFGGQGRGPGEFLLVNNFYLNDDYLYVVDPVQFRIIKYSLDGEVDGSLDYGMKSSQSLPPPAPQSLIPRAKDISNSLFVTASRDVLLPAIRPNEKASSLYTLANWEGKDLAEVGDIPEGSAFVLDGKQYRDAVNDREVPAFYKSNVFPVSNDANDDEFYFIYTAFPKIVKYHTSGEKRWERDLPETTEMDSVFTHFFDISGKMRGKSRISLDTYMSGVSSEEGHLYLVLGKNGFEDESNDLWIHEFNDNAMDNLAEGFNWYLKMSIWLPSLILILPTGEYLW